MQLDVFTDKCDLHFVLRTAELRYHMFPVGKIRLRAVKL